MSLVSRGKEIAYSTSEYIKDKIEDVKRWANDRANFVRNKIQKKPQTLEYYWIDSPTSKDLVEALSVLCSNLHNPLVIQKNTSKKLAQTLKIYNPDLTVQNISQRLLQTLKRKNFPINVKKMENLYNEIKAIQRSGKDANTQKKEIQDKLNELSSQEKLSLSQYAHNIPFWITQTKDGNPIEKLTIPELHKKMPPHPWKFPTKPTKEDFPSKSDHSKAISQWRKDKVARNKQHRKWKNRSCDTKFQDHTSKRLGDLWILNRFPNLLAKIISDITVWLIWKWQPDIVDYIFNPKIVGLSEQDKAILAEIIRGLQNWENYFFMLNHDTFANIPVTDLTIWREAKAQWRDNINKQEYIGIGDLIECNSDQDAVVNMLWNIIPTTPTTNNIPWDKVISRLRRENFANQVERKLVPEKNPKKSHRKRKNKGHAVLCAASGTRDVIHRTKSWKCHIFIPDETQISNKTTIPFVRKLAKEWVHIIAVSTNTAEFKKPNLDEWVTANNNAWNHGATMTIHFNKINDIDKLSNGDIIEILAKWITQAIPIYEEKQVYNPNDDSYTSYLTIKGYTERPCGIKIPSDIFSYIKNLTKDSEYARTASLPEEIFIDEEEWILNFELIRQRIKEQDEQKRKKEAQKKA